VRGAERALGRLEGVHEIDAPIGSLRIGIVPAEDRVLDFAAIRPALWKEGIRTRGIAILAEGSVEGGAGGGTFRIRGWPSAFPVRGDVPAPGVATMRADVSVEEGRTVLRITGR